MQQALRRLARTPTRGDVDRERGLQGRGSEDRQEYLFGEVKRRGGDIRTTGLYGQELITISLYMSNVDPEDERD